MVWLPTDVNPLGERGTDAVERAETVPADLQRAVEVDGHETGPVAGLGLGEPVAVDADDGAERGVAAAGHRVLQQHDRLDPARDLHRPDGVAAVGDVSGVAAGAEGLLARNELQLGATE